MDAATEPRVLIPPQTVRLTRNQEDVLIEFAKQRLDHFRRAMGWNNDLAYERNSWLWRRLVATRMFEDDFSHRKQEARIFEQVNLSLNMVAQLIEQHKSRITKDLVGSDAFFGVLPDGAEDQSPVLKDVERWLQRQGRRMDLQEQFKTGGVLGAMIRGEAVSKTTLNVCRKIETRRARVQLNSDGAPVHDSKGGLVTNLDRWVPHPDNPTLKMLERDPLLQMAADGVPLYAPQEMDVPVTLHETRGAHVSFPYWGDLVAPVDAVSLDDAELVAHVFNRSPADLLDSLPVDGFGMAIQDYKAEVMQRGDVGEPADQGEMAEHRGEFEQKRPAVDPGAYQERRYDEIYLRYDWRGNGRPDRLAMLIDRELGWPIYYGLASEVMPWTDRPHPFQVWRIMAVDGRWYGRGYYGRYGSQADFADKCWCRMELELRKSGNLVWENRELHAAGRAGKPLRFRSPETVQIEQGARPEDVVGVVTVKPQVAEINSAMQMTLQKLQSEAGVLGPGDPTTEALNNSDTLGEAQIQEANKSVSIEEREAELVLGMNATLQAMAEIELNPATLDVRALAAMLENTSMAGSEPLPQMVATREAGLVPMDMAQAMAGGGEGAAGPGALPPGAPQGGAPAVGPPGIVAGGPPKMSGSERAERVLAWAKTAGSDLRDTIKVFLTKSRQTQLFDRASKILQLLEKWLSYPPEVRKVVRPVFIDLLRAMDVQSPDALLGPDEPLNAGSGMGAPLQALPAPGQQQAQPAAA